MEQLIVDNNLDRYSYEGVTRHQEIKEIVTKKWEEYDECIEDVETIKEAKKCAGEKEESDQNEAEIEQDSEIKQDNSEKNEQEPEIKEAPEEKELETSEAESEPGEVTKVRDPDIQESPIQNLILKRE